MNDFSFIISFVVDLKGHFAFKKSANITNIFSLLKKFLNLCNLLVKHIQILIHCCSIAAIQNKIFFGRMLMHRQGSKASISIGNIAGKPTN